uniref:Uncharacterized protein n=1 Tax=Arundo donax TaxID=35708 RepID=A0A0A9C4E2_ARUDO
MWRACKATTGSGWMGALEHTRPLLNLFPRPNNDLTGRAKIMKARGDAPVLSAACLSP